MQGHQFAAYGELQVPFKGHEGTPVFRAEIADDYDPI